MIKIRTRTVVLGTVLLLAATACGDDDAGPADANEPESTEPAPVFSSEEALSVTDAYFAANSAADFDALLALFTPEATFTGGFHIAEDEEVFVWNAAQGTKISEPDCTVTGETSTQATVRCTFFNLDALVQAVDGPQVPITLSLTVTPDGISNENGRFGQPDFNAVGLPFDAWLIENHPGDLDKVGFVEWASIEEAEAGGTLKAQYAQEWATYLEANGCTYLDEC